MRYPRDPKRLCDIVMKGGITSGVVYPLAICKIAEKFRLQNIGGTSAGAIAAALAAAAEYGRRNTGRGFAVLEGLPAWIGDPAAGSEDSNLFHLFQPSRKTRRLFALLVAAISHPAATQPFEIVFSALWNSRRLALAGLAPGLAGFVVSFLALGDAGGWLAPFALVFALLAAVALALLGAIALSAVGIVKRDLPAAVANSYGICSGLTQDDRYEALTPWLHDRIQEASGAAGVLTFGHLWGEKEGPRDLELTMITTNLTFGRPYKLPFRLEDGFSFKPIELENFFPAAVIEQLAGGTPSDKDALVPLPAPRDLPVVFAARLSLSFPGLLSAIPLWHGTGKDAMPCVFSDGGICSNFPIELFDSPLPRWPTLGVNLGGEIPRTENPVWIDGLGQAPPARQPIKGLLGFLSGIRGAMQNWHDNRYVELPGYRDRIALVSFYRGEGGLNLNMPKSVIDSLSARGEQAGERLADLFAAEASDSRWNAQRRMRLRTALGALEDFAMTFAVGYSGDPEMVEEPRRFRAIPPRSGEATYESLLQPSTEPGVGLDERQSALAGSVLEALAPPVTAWGTTRGRDLPPQESPSLMAGVPEPAPEFRPTPDL